MVNKIKSVILGHAVADALGVPAEFRTREELDANPITDMVGYGTYNMPAGCWSDDTSMTLAALDSLAAGKVDYDEIMESIYVAGADLSGTDIEERAKGIERSNIMLKYVDHAGEDQERRSVLSGAVFQTYRHMSRLAMRRLHRHWWTQDTRCTAKQWTEYHSLAVDCISSILWVFSARDCREIFDRFVRE